VLLRSINSQLEHRGLKVQGSRGAILDATIIPSAARPNGYIDMDGHEPQVVTSNGIAPDDVMADKCYASKANRQYLKERGMADLIQHKGAKGKPLSPILKRLNTAIGGLRFKVEQAFGTMKRKFHLARARYFGAGKVQAQMCWAALGMNLLKAHRKLARMQQPIPQGTGAPA